MTKTTKKPIKKTTKKTAVKASVDTAQALSAPQQWLVVALLVVILFLFACLVYGADLLWYANS